MNLISIISMRKLRPREVKQLTQVTELVTVELRYEHPGSLASEPVP